jgi:RluA family pseudouridine synthase
MGIESLSEFYEAKGIRGLKEKTFRCIVDEGGDRLDAYVARRLDRFGIKKTQIHDALSRGRCLINGEVERFASRRLRSGEELIYYFYETPELKGVASSEIMRSRVLFEDQWLYVISKPHGVAYDAELSIKNDLFPVHRLDKETSGVLLFAKEVKIAKSLMESFKERLIKKIYCAVCRGVSNFDSGTCKSYLGTVKRYQGQELQGIVASGGREAITQWNVRDRFKVGKNDYCIMECRPLTGRKHQIRVHLKGLNLPILGDALYAPSDVVVESSRMLLHAEKVTFHHPVTGKRLQICDPVPAIFSGLEVSSQRGVTTDGA